ncbi:MAG: septum formation family protein [Woeseiaceae bacterium]|nr:septum formation family protein [Woeseiaceae bacterium]
MKNLMIYALIGLGVVAYNVSTQADRDGTGAIVGEGSVNAFTIRIGDCFNDTASISTAEGGEVSSLPAVPCSEPHDNEVYAVFDLGVAEFPEGNAMSTMAFDACRNRFESFVGVDYESSALDILALYPTRESWELQGDREVVCAVFEMNAKKLTGSARNTAI